MNVLLGLLDSGVSAELSSWVVAAKGFELTPAGETVAQPVREDRLGHGSALARIIVAVAPQARIINAQVFRRAGPTPPAVIAAGLDWLVNRGAHIVNMGFGSRQDRRPLREACARAREAGVILVSASPARGPGVYPSAYPGVLRVTGDARCAAGEFSHLATDNADFGACPRIIAHSDPRVGGASFATAYITGELANYLERGGKPVEAETYLESVARYFGPERRTHYG